MSEIVQRIEGDQKAALKAREKERLSALRLLTSELKNRRIELQRDLTDDDAIEILSKALKQRQEAAEQFTRGNRPELAARESAEAGVIREYLPEPVSEEELDGMIDAAIAEVGATSMRDMGAVMGRLMPLVKGRADGAAVSARVKERLG
ncbi:MAG TPA: GatB/YqeY domain-containing protein [Gemmatimonadota bacterium]|nr:GatB/YqeY domain-containing protein [Gemmatimonadota bacterium]